MELNLRPNSLVRAQRTAAQRPYLIAAGIAVLASLAGWWQFNLHAAAETVKVTETLTTKAAPLKNFEGQISSTKSDISTLQEYMKPLLKAPAERQYWLQVINDLNSRLPQDYIWVTAFEPPKAEDIKKREDAEANSSSNKKGKKGDKGDSSSGPSVVMNVRGIYLSRDAGNNAAAGVFDQFVEKLKESPYFEPLTDAKDGFLRGGDDTNDWGFKVAVALKLKNPIDLK